MKIKWTRPWAGRYESKYASIRRYASVRRKGGWWRITIRMPELDRGLELLRYQSLQHAKEAVATAVEADQKRLRL